MENQETMMIGETFQKLVFSRAKELNEKGETQGVVDEKTLGGLEIFLDKKPESLLMSLPYPDDGTELANMVIYLGSNTIAQA